MNHSLQRRAVAEFVGTSLLLATVVGSGIMGDRLAGGNQAIALMANSLATGAVLIALILTFGSISGSHLNPLVSFVDAWQGGISWLDAAAYSVAQFVGALAGVGIANLMFGLAAFSQFNHIRSGHAQLLSECVATFGLFAVIWGCVRHRPDAVPFAVGTYITAAYWFTASTSFANPAVTVARAWTDTFSGIRLADTAPFVGAQTVGALLATLLFSWLSPLSVPNAKDVLQPHRGEA
jgi:Glycerol uptake facilitator and related permeases (Major Intrinsic Protein Family)